MQRACSIQKACIESSAKTAVSECCVLAASVGELLNGDRMSVVTVSVRFIALDVPHAPQVPLAGRVAKS